MLLKNIESVPSFLAGDHTILKEILHPKNDPVDIDYSIAFAKIETGKSSLPHRLAQSEVYIFLEGEGIIFIEKEDQKVKKNDLVFVPKNALQKVKNTGTTDLSFLCIVHPKWEEKGEEILNE